MRRLSIFLVALVLLAPSVVRAGGRLDNAEFIKGFEAAFAAAKEKGASKLSALGERCYAAGFWREARKCFEAVLAEKPDDRLANTRLGRVYYRKKWMEPAERDRLLREENAPRRLLGGKFLAPAEYDKALAAARAKVGWDFDFFFALGPRFRLYFKGEEDDAWSVRRLLESFFRAWEMEFGKKVGLPRDPLPVHVFESRAAMEAFVGRATGQAVSAPAIFDPRTAAAYTYYTPKGGDFCRDMIVEAAARGVMGLLGNNGNFAGEWVHIGLVYYFRLARTGDETVFIGAWRPYHPDLAGIAARLAREGSLPAPDSFASLSAPAFSNDPGDTLRAASWALIYYLNHAGQGRWKADFHAFLKGAMKGRASYKFLKKMKRWKEIEKGFAPFVRSLTPAEE